MYLLTTELFFRVEQAAQSNTSFYNEYSLDSILYIIRLNLIQPNSFEIMSNTTNLVLPISYILTT